MLQLPNHRELQVFHFDLYRMQTPTEWQEAGLLEHFDQQDRQDRATLCIVEWPQKAEHTLPTMDLAITLAHPSTPLSELARTIDIAAMTAKGEAILNALTNSIFVLLTLGLSVKIRQKSEVYWKILQWYVTGRPDEVGLPDKCPTSMRTSKS